MADLLNNVNFLHEQEKSRLDQIIAGRQEDRPRPVVHALLVIGAALLGLGVSSLLQTPAKPRQELQNHPRCGITTGGAVS